MADDPVRPVPPPDGFPHWLGRFPGPAGTAQAGAADTEPGPTTVVFPHAGGSAVNYRALAIALSAKADTYVVQYPGRADRRADPVAQTVPDLARELFDVAPWPDRLCLFGHSMGALVAFEFARLAEAAGITVQRLSVSACAAPSTVSGLRRLPTGDDELRADLARLGGTDPRLLADPEFLALLLTPLRADYQAFNRYRCAPGMTVRAGIEVLGGRSDQRVPAHLLQPWVRHTTDRCNVSLYNGGHFYLHDHVDAVVRRITDV